MTESSKWWGSALDWTRGFHFGKPTRLCRVTAARYGSAPSRQFERTFSPLMMTGSTGAPTSARTGGVVSRRK